MAQSKTVQIAPAADTIQMKTKTKAKRDEYMITKKREGAKILETETVQVHV